MLEIGNQCPDFNTIDEKGQTVNVNMLRGSYVVLFFYPKDSTPGCTIEAKAFSSAYTEFAKLNTKVFGISKDTQNSHIKFITKHALTTPLLLDEDKSLCEAFGVLKEKSMFGKKYMGIVRSTFLIDPDGKIIQIWSPVKINGHVEAVLSTLTQLSQQ